MNHTKTDDSGLTCKKVPRINRQIANYCTKENGSIYYRLHMNVNEAQSIIPISNAPLIISGWRKKKGEKRIITALIKDPNEQIYMK